METIDTDRWVRIYASLAHARTILTSDFLRDDPARLAYATIKARRHLDRILDELDT
jgi:hypothetical protein